MKENRLTVYSNGITRVQRFVPVKGKTALSIPVRKAYVGDVLATLRIRGDSVKQVEPPSYNNGATQKTLSLDPTKIRRELAIKLSGAAVKLKAYGVTDEISGTVMGIHERNITENGQTTVKIEISVLSGEGKITSIAEDNIAWLEFTQPEVQRLIKNALAKNFETVRPDSVLINLLLDQVDSRDNAEALLDYILPTAAWQSLYKLSTGKKTPAKATLECSAKIDNPTDEDWPNSRVTVIVGEPISLDNSLAEVIVPSRTKVDLASRQSAAPVKTKRALRHAKGIVPASAGFASDDGGALESMVGDVNYCKIDHFGNARVNEALAEEQGDFAIFTSQDVIDVRNNLSGVVHLYSQEVEATEVLFYDAGQDSSRAHRGVRLTNSTKNTLGRGIFTYYCEDVFSGQHTLEGVIKPGQSRTLTFSPENGVEVNTKIERPAVSRMAVGMANGEIWWQDRHIVETTYNFSNLYKDQAFDLEVDHDFSQNTPEYSVSDGIKVEKTAAGAKLKTRLESDDVVNFVVTETTLIKSGWTLEGVSGFNRLSGFFVTSNDVWAKKIRASSEYKKLESLKAEWDVLNTRAEELNTEANALKEEQERLLNMVKAGHTASQLDKWQTRLDAAEDRICAIEKKEAVKMAQSIKEKEAEIDAALKAFVFNWAEGSERK